MFLDADVRLLDQGMKRLVETHKKLGGIVSVQPYLITGRFSERLSLFFYLVAAFSLSILRRTEGMFGACVLISRKDYERLGGHKVVFDELIEDVLLAQKAASLNIKVHNFVGKGAVAANLYPDGLRDVIEGWAKTFPLGARLISLFSFLLVFFWMSGAISSEVIIFKDGNPVFYLIYAVQIFVAGRMLGNLAFF